MNKCYYRMKRGWWCSAGAGHDGPCPLRPSFWNLRDFLPYLKHLWEMR